MFYEEKVIEGILHFRTSTDSNFMPCTKKVLTDRILARDQERQRDIEGLQRIKVHFAGYQWEKLQYIFPGLV